MHQVEVSPAQISNVTVAVIEEVKAGKRGPLDAIYPIVYQGAPVVTCAAKAGGNRAV